MQPQTNIHWQALEEILARDPGQRGLTAARWRGERLGAGNLERAAQSLANSAQHVGIVTGFCVGNLNAPSPETDGPPGALFLARALLAAGIEVSLITDCHALPLLAEGIDLWKLRGAELVEFPFEEAATWIESFFASPRGQALTHLIAIERVGPSHTAASLAEQCAVHRLPADTLRHFEQLVPAESRNICQNMRGVSVDAVTAPTHLLFDALAERRLPISTIAMADGGNEIGMGSLPWDVLRQAIAGEAAPRIVCRVPADFLIVAGVSNWAAYALALSVAMLRGMGTAAEQWTTTAQQALIEHLVRRAGAVDGVTRAATATVDGLPPEVYLNALASMRRIVGLRRLGGTP